ncbi:YqaA family protein [Sneathiella sp.]|uniref:YqaA family protein n=1 Tax=Sneathiella sp. TaxID=1964365 RepID=UPI0035618E14
MTPFALYGSLALSAFLSATLLPGTSEGLFAYYIATESGSPMGLLLAAVIGNVAGSMLNWVLGRFLARFRGRKWFPVSEKRYDQAQRGFARYGQWTLLFAWLPVIGDPLTIVAGALRVPPLNFLFWVTLGKLGRYLLVLQAAQLLAG